jgi:hypothetical protein
VALHEKVHAQAIEQARKLYPGTIAVGLLTWPDLSGSAGMAAQGPMLPNKAEKAAMQARAGGLPSRLALAVTPTHYFASAYRSGLGGLKLKEEVGTWPRDQVRTAVSFPYGGDDHFRVVLTMPGKQIELDGADANGVNRDFLAAIT